MYVRFTLQLKYWFEFLTIGIIIYGWINVTMNIWCHDTLTPLTL